MEYQHMEISRCLASNIDMQNMRNIMYVVDQEKHKKKFFKFWIKLMLKLLKSDKAQI